MRISLIGILFVLPLLAASGLAGGETKVVFEDSGEDWAQRYILIPPEEFSSVRVQDLARQQLSAFENRRVVKIAIGTTRDDLLEVRRGKAMADYAYQLWETAFIERLQRREPLAVMIGIGKNAALQIRHAGGQSERVILLGHDPTWLSTGSSGARIVHVGFSRTPWNETTRVFATFFLVSKNGLTLNSAANLAGIFRRTVEMSETVLAIFREDSWFIEEEDFPVFDLFGTPAAPLALDKYVCSPTVVCGYSDGTPNCRNADYLFGSCH